MTAKRLCREDNWDRVLGDDAPRAVRWSAGYSNVLHSETFSRWHYTEGNGAFTACGQPIVLNPGRSHSTFPQEGELRKVQCRRCLQKMTAAGVAQK